MIHLTLTIDCPAADLEGLLTLLRQWQGERPDRTLALQVEAPARTAAALTPILDRLHPPLPGRPHVPRPPVEPAP
jgi:hypothetical protein